MRITAAVLSETRASLELCEVEIDEPRDDEVLVRLAATGVCHTDLLVRDRLLPPAAPVVLGHEGAGVVERVGKSVTGVAVGDHVVLTYSACGGCRECLGGRPAYCLDFFGRNLSGGRPDGSRTLTRDGEPVSGSFFGQSSFATYALASAANVVVVPRRFNLELLGPLGCGFQTGAGAVLNVLKPAVGGSLVVFGVGAVGLTAVMAACAVGCGTVIAVDRHRHRLSLAAELGAHQTLDASAADIVEEIVDLTGGGADCAVDATGVPGVLGQAVACLSVGGACALVGAAPLGSSGTVDLNHLLWGRSIRGVIEGAGVPRLFIPRLLGMWERGAFPFDRLIETFSLADINEAMNASEKGMVIKPVVTMRLADAPVS